MMASHKSAHDNSSADRLSVADILSSMANGGDEPQHNTTLTGIDGMTCGIPTRTTPTLTPTTLKNIEESFMELQSIPPAPLEHQHQAGFVPPVVAFSGLPLKQEDPQWMDDCMQSSDRSMESPGPINHIPRSAGASTSNKSGRSGGRRPNKDEKLSPEEEERRRVRRERNKLAAARCRKRRMDHTNSLLQETEGLEEKRQNLQNEIHMLNCQKEELEFILEAHRVTCKLSGQPPHSKSRAEKQSVVVSKSKSYSRPNSLALSSSYGNSGNSKSTAGGDSVLNTPSSTLYNFESLVETNDSSQSGLPLVISSCSSQQRSSSSDLSSPDSTPPKLVLL